MVQRLLKFGLYGLGLSAILIGGAMALFGPHLVGTFFNTVSGLSCAAGLVTDLAAVNVDSEMRFYALMFVFYGGVLVRTSKHYKTHFKHIPLLLSVFFLAGMARVIGVITVGTPHPLFVILMCIELGLPVVLMSLWTLEKKRMSE